MRQDATHYHPEGTDSKRDAHQTQAAQNVETHDWLPRVLTRPIPGKASLHLYGKGERIMQASFGLFSGTPPAEKSTANESILSACNAKCLGDQIRCFNHGVGEMKSAVPRSPWRSKPHLPWSSRKRIPLNPPRPRAPHEISPKLPLRRHICDRKKKEKNISSILIPNESRELPKIHFKNSCIPCTIRQIGSAACFQG